MPPISYEVKIYAENELKRGHRGVSPNHACTTMLENSIFYQLLRGCVSPVNPGLTSYACSE